MKKILINYVLLLGLTSSAFTQSFETDALIKNISISTNSSTPGHAFFDLINNTNDTLNLRWKLNQSLTSYSHSWDIALQDRDYYHNPIIDSNDVVLPVISGSLDKLVLNLTSNGNIGNGQVVIDIYNLDSLTEVVQIKFNLSVTAATNNIFEINTGQIFNIYPNPTNSVLYVPKELSKSKISVLNTEGKLILEEILDDDFLDVSDLNSGFYYLFLAKGLINYSSTFFKE